MEEALFCDHCGEPIDDEEGVKMYENEIFDQDRNYSISEQTCLKCRKEIRDERDELAEDYSMLHPDETAEEFAEHEDHASP